MLCLGRTRFDRLLLIGQSSVPLCLDALKAAVAEAKKGKDIQRYRDAWECIRLAGPNEPEAQFDNAWVNGTTKLNTILTNQLEAELKGYKNNLVKESIRVRACHLTNYEVGMKASTNHVLARLVTVILANI